MNAIQKELQKCKDDPYYFATTYLKIYDSDGNSHPYTTHLTKEEFNKLFLNIKSFNSIFV